MAFSCRCALFITLAFLFSLAWALLPVVSKNLLSSHYDRSVWYRNHFMAWALSKDRTPVIFSLVLAFQPWHQRDLTPLCKSFSTLLPDPALNAHYATSRLPTADSSSTAQTEINIFKTPSFQRQIFTTGEENFLLFPFIMWGIQISTSGEIELYGRISSF